MTPEKQTEITTLANALSVFINCSTKDETREVAKRVTDDHRTLQQSTMSLFMECIAIWAKDADNENYDERNKATCEISRKITNMFNDTNKDLYLFTDGRRFLGLPYV